MLSDMIFYFGAFSDIDFRQNTELLFSSHATKCFQLAEDAFSDAPIEDDVLNFLESQRLRESDILTGETEKETQLL